jgi:IclR family mhp operon transcriptional activator
MLRKQQSSGKNAMAESIEKYKQVRSINRGLDVLVALNDMGRASISALSVRTKIHRTTMYRVLETLETLGYVRRSHTDDSFYLTSQVRSLSDGYDESERIAGAASDSLNALTDEVEWPCSVATPHQGAMIIRETTHGRSELFVHDVRVGTRSPVLTTAMGRAYLANCDEEERKCFLSTVATLQTPEALLARDGQYVERIVTTTRDAGYGASFGDASSRLGSVAMPIREGERVVGCVNVVFFHGVVARNLVVGKFVPALERAVGAIERKLNKA